MTFAIFAFYLFSLIAILAALNVVLARNPVHSVLWLILTFISAACLFVLMGAEFLAMLLMIVYVGAVAVLFLFVVMMLNVDFAELRAGFTRYLPIGIIISIVLAVELIVLATARSGDSGAVASMPIPENVENTRALGQVIYTDYVFMFLTVGMVLFVAMIGAIVLTHRRRDDVKRQNVLAQMYRDPTKAMELKDVKPGQGL